MNKCWFAGTIRLHTWVRFLPVYVSPMMWAPGIAVGSFGRIVYIAYA